MSVFFISALFAFALGAILGSFLNVVIFRSGTGEGFGGRSRCMHCKRTLAAKDLVPFFSYLYLGGRCRYCRTRISPQYPLVEGAAGALSLCVFLTHPNPTTYAAGLLIWMTYLFLTVYDLKHQVLPMPGLVGAGALSLVIGFFMVPPDMSYWWFFLSGPIIASPLLLLSAASGGRWMGWGDGLLALSLGWLLGLTGGLTALVLAFWSGAIVGLLLILCSTLWRRPAWGSTIRNSARRALGLRLPHVTMQSAVPFAPFLILGAAVVYFLHVDIVSLLII